MHHRKPAENMLWVILFFLAATFGLNGCSDVNNVSGPPAPAAPGPLTILTASPLPAGAVQADYNVTLALIGGTPPYTWSLAAGSPTLPDGLALTSSNGKILGVPTSPTGTRLTEFKLQDSEGQSIQKVLAITVNASPTALAILTNSLPDGPINQLYAFALSPTGGTTPYTWGLKAGSTPLPNGLTLTSNGVISGTPTVTSNATHIFTLTDATPLTIEKSLQLSVNAIPLSITTSSLPQGTANQSYSETLAATGGTGTYTWGLTGGSPALPAGLTLNASTGLLSGVPTGLSNLTHTFTVTDQTPPTPQTATKTLQLNIEAAPPNLIITPNSPLPPGTVTQPYNMTLTSSGGTGAKTWDITNGSLPAGLNVSASGVISGTPQATGTSSPTFRVRDSGNPQDTATKQLSITITLPAAPNITTTSASLLPNGTFNQSYSRTLTVQNGTPPFVWSFTGGSPFPNWLNLNTSTGVISGTPNATGTFNFNVQVTDNTGQSDPNPPSLSITIVPQAPPSITPFTLPNGTVNQQYPTLQSPNIQLAATGGIPPYTWSVNPALPNGLSFSPSGLISGIPLAGSNGTTTHTFRVTDDTNPTGQFSELTRNLTINAELTINQNSPLPAGTEGQGYNTTLTASGGAPPYTWSITGTGQPNQAAPGLTLSSDGVISGTLSTTNGSPFFRTYRVQDNNGVATTKSLAITVNAALTIDTTSPLPDGKESQSYGPLTMQASGGTPPYKDWSVTPALPTGLTLDPPTGQIIGIPDVGTAGTTMHDFSVTDDANVTVSKLNISLTIDPP